MRVADATALAEFVLGWDRDAIVQAMTAGPDNHRVELREPVPVFVLYDTVAVQDGRVSFFDDIYGYDAALAHALDKRYTGGVRRW
jgi:L,D-transpeptidase YcbB